MQENRFKQIKSEKYKVLPKKNTEQPKKKKVTGEWFHKYTDDNFT